MPLLWNIFFVLFTSIIIATTATEILENEIDNDMSNFEEDIGEDNRERRQTLRHPSFLSLAPPDTIYAPNNRIAFDYSTNVDSIPDRLIFSARDEGLRYLDGSKDDEDYSQWSLVTSSGLEYKGSARVLSSFFAEARLDTLDRSDGIYSSEEPTGDGTTTFPFSSLTLNRSSLTDGLTRFQRSVFSPDTRVEVSNPAVYPWSAMGRVDSGCTGTFIGPRHILTAGHCVYSRTTKKWLGNLNFRRRKDCNPHQGVLYKWKWAITVKGWKDKGWASYDYAMIVVDTPSPVWMSYGWRKPIPKFTINIAGYPGDKPGRCNWRTHCKIKYRFSKQLGYKCDTFDGMSGSAVYAYRRSSNKRVIYCIHAYGKTPSKNYNKCTRITKFRFKLLKGWINKY